MNRATLVVLIPVGPRCQLDHISDTIESIRHYTTSCRVVIILDDSGKDTGAALKELWNDIVVLKTETNLGKAAGLYLNLSRGLSFAHENYDFDVILRLDTDALIIGPHPEQDAIDYFKRHPRAGIIGSHRTDCNGAPRDFSRPRRTLIDETRLRHLLADPLRRWKGWLWLRRSWQQARKNGYEAGEHCMGGAVFMSRHCLDLLASNGLLSRHEIASSKLQEDQIFGLLIHAVGLRHGDFATGQQPMGVRWRGLPCSPSELIRRGKKVTHSTRFFENVSEQEIRAFFKAQRQQDSRDQEAAAGAGRSNRRHA